MKEQIRDLEKQSGIDVYSLGLDRAKWESKLEKFAELIVREVFAKIEDERFEVYQSVKESVMKHFGVEE